MGSLDEILAGGEAVSEGKTEENVTQTATEGEGQTEQETEGQSTEGEGGQRVPVAALQAERQKVKRYTEEVADFRKALTETNASFERRMAELVEAVKPNAEPVAAPDQFDDFQGATRHAVKPEFDRYDQSLEAQNTRWEKRSQREAVKEYGADIVKQAYEAVGKFVDTGSPEAGRFIEYLRKESDHPFDDLVQWHKKQQIKAEIGDDPVAYEAKVETKVLAKYGLTPETAAQSQQGGQQQQEQPAARVAPSNLAGATNKGARTGPAWAGPASLSDIFDRRKASG